MPSLQEITDRIAKHPKMIIADDYEVVVENRLSRSYDYQNGERIQSGNIENIFVSLRIVHRNRPGRATGIIGTVSQLDLLVDHVFLSAQRSEPDPWFRLPILKSPATQTKPTVDETGDWEHDSLYGSIETPPSIFEEHYERTIIENRLTRKFEKLSLGSQRALYSLCFQVTDSSSEGEFSLKEKRAFARPLKERKKWLSHFLNEAQSRKGAQPIFSGVEGTVVFSPKVVAKLLEHLAPWFNARRVQLGTSPLSGLKGTQFGAPTFELFDDPTLEGGTGTQVFDLEGTLCSRTHLVEQGRLADLLYDTYAATRENRRSTGNLNEVDGSFGSAIGPSNFFVAPLAGAQRPERGVENGIVLLDASIQQIDPFHPGRLRVDGHGWRILKGECTDPFYGICFDFDVLERFPQIEAIGANLDFFGGFGAPSILFEKMPL